MMFYADIYFFEKSEGGESVTMILFAVSAEFYFFIFFEV